MSNQLLLYLRLGVPIAILLAWRVSPSGYVLKPDEGEVLRRPNGSVIIKVDPRRGSGRIAMGTQELDARSGIRVHKHDNADEVLYIQKGGATAILGDQRSPVGPGTTIYIPRGVWHGVEGAGPEIQLLWIVSPPGLEGFFREIGAPPGTPVKQLTAAEMEEIGRKHGTRFK